MPDYHAKRSPSGGAKRMLYCAAAPEREAHYPDTTVQVEPHLLTRQAAPAQWGTASHLILELAIKNTISGQSVAPPQGMCYLIPNTESYPDDEYQEMCRVAQVTYDYVYGPTTDGAPRSVRSEERVYPGKLIGVEDDLDGTADVQIVTDRMLEVVDHKTGRGHVGADTEQNRYYLAGAIVPYMDLLGNIPFDILRSTIVQPLGEDPQEIRSHDYTPAEILTWMNGTVYPAYERSLDLNAVATPSAEGCKWCRVADCKERAEWVMNGVTQINQDIGRNEPHIPDITTLSDEQIMTVHDYAPLLQSFVKTVDSFIETTKRQDPTRFPLLKFTPRLGNSKWVESEEKMAVKLKNQKFKKADYTVTKVKSPAQMLKIADAKQKEYLKKQIVRPEIGFKLVPVTNEDQNAFPSASEVFGKLEDKKDQPAADPFACLA